ncbi:unnamed protein product [Anisakis simplex]|uniref:Uncharacterized protein n=1 Tax=Anisakis simplex TaxID=6269 RepID=A0A3P6Q6E3_ANISI|nr:unnamed protein product [Anisakis simplex]
MLTLFTYRLSELGGMMKNKLAILLTQFAADGNSVKLNERLDSLGDASKGTYGQIMSARLAKVCLMFTDQVQLRVALSTL